MSMEEKYGNFSIRDLIFYDEQERERFQEKFIKPYRKHISKMEIIKADGKDKVKQNRKERKDNKMHLGWLNLQIRIDESNNLMDMVGYGHRNAIFPIEMYIRKLFDDGRIVSYEAADNLNRSFSVDGRSIDEEIKDFLNEKKRRLELFEKGELEPPKDREEEGPKLTK